jgi:hypothetical protein
LSIPPNQACDRRCILTFDTIDSYLYDDYAICYIFYGLIGRQVPSRLDWFVTTA